MPSAEHEFMVEMMSDGMDLSALSLEEQRAAMEASAELFPPDDDVTAEVVDADGVPAEWVTVPSSRGRRVVLYLHGGAYVMGSSGSHRGLAGRIARAADASVLLPNYRLAPEHVFPAAVEDALACWRWLLGKGFEPAQMTIAGDSAGGGLALATLLALKEAGESLPACGVGLSPWTDLTGSGPSAQPGIVDDPMLTLSGLIDSGRDYAAHDVNNPLASPLLGDLAGLPPLLLQVGTREILLSDSTRFAERATAAGTSVTLEVEEGLIHVWQMFPDLPEAQQAVQRIGRFIRQHTGSPSVTA